MVAFGRPPRMVHHGSAHQRGGRRGVRLDRRWRGGTSPIAFFSTARSCWGGGGESTGSTASHLPRWWETGRGGGGGGPTGAASPTSTRSVHHRSRCPVLLLVLIVAGDVHLGGTRLSFPSPSPYARRRERGGEGLTAFAGCSSGSTTTAGGGVGSGVFGYVLALGGVGPSRTTARDLAPPPRPTHVDVSETRRTNDPRGGGGGDPFSRAKKCAGARRTKRKKARPSSSSSSLCGFPCGRWWKAKEDPAQLHYHHHV